MTLGHVRAISWCGHVKKLQGTLRMAGIVAGRGGDIAPAVEAQQRKGRIAESRQRLGRCTSPELATIFTERFIADVVHPVLDCPVAAPDLLRLRGAARQVTRQADQTIGYLSLQTTGTPLDFLVLLSNLDR
jgi:hypothetical protein